MNNYITFPELITQMKNGDIADCESKEWSSIIKMNGVLFNYDAERNQMGDTLVVNDSRVAQRYKIRIHLRFEPWPAAFMALKEGHTIRGYDPEDIDSGCYEISQYDTFGELAAEYGCLDFALLFQLSWYVMDKREEN